MHKTVATKRKKKPMYIEKMNKGLVYQHTKTEKNISVRISYYKEVLHTVSEPEKKDKTSIAEGKNSRWITEIFQHTKFSLNR